VHPIHELGSPLDPKVAIHLSREYYRGKTFAITAKHASKENKFIQSAGLNGKPLKRWWLRQHEILSGGRLELELGPTPNQAGAKGCPLPD